MAALCAPPMLSAQGYRGEVRLSGSSVGLQPLVRDSLPVGQVEGDGSRRRLPDGTVVTCVPDRSCSWYRSAGTTTFSTMTQELELTAWSGIQGLSAHTRLRGWYGSDGDWPLSSHRFEAVDAYVTYETTDLRVRGGRQHRLDGLGYTSFDGLEVDGKGLGPVRLEGYGGWSLAPNLDVPRTSSLLGNAEPLIPDDRGFVLGLGARARAGDRISGSATYQRIIRTDRGALYSERLAADARALLGGVALDLATTYDFSFQEFNEARISATVPVARRMDVRAELRHYSPFFELWTIWGAFSPVGYDEARGSVGWLVPGLSTRVDAGGGYRSYEDPSAGSNIAGLRDTGWRLFGGAHWSSRGWFAGGSYQAEMGPGAAIFGGDVDAGYTFSSGTYLSLRGSSTQSSAEYRFGSDRLTGAALEASLRVGEVSLTGSGGVYRLTHGDRPAVEPYTQGRVYLGLRYAFGTEAGVLPAEGGP